MNYTWGWSGFHTEFFVGGGGKVRINLTIKYHHL